MVLLLVCRAPKFSHGGNIAEFLKFWGTRSSDHYNQVTIDNVVTRVVLPEKLVISKIEKSYYFFLLLSLMLNADPDGRCFLAAWAFSTSFGKCQTETEPANLEG